MDDLVHDRSRVTAAVLDHHRIAALALDERGDVGLSEFTPEDQEIALPMPEL
ncbi:DNA-binding helix-hairpin-helix protein with protein kinase domain [Rhizobium leguminosarum]|jgi:DNA-binding helix-hairpin-helix protein with protein kinase domain|nr:DNA-binding helix-hairpin-helix protein with protein kinase domain [Rhizobium leguminosarum]MBB4552105.1 DNA-binding helix-hairpin-helix protein with protein kinase domain [Rhizobium leguminosarum]